MRLLRRVIEKMITIDFKENIKYCLRMLLLSCVVIVILLLIRNEIFVLLMTFFIGNYGLDYIMSRNNMAQKLKCQMLYTKDFNESYFDMYNEYKQNKFTLLYNSQILTISIVQLLIKPETVWHEYISLCMIACGVVMILMILYFSYNKKEKSINALIFERKRNWVGEYSEKEEELLKLFVADGLD